MMWGQERMQPDVIGPNLEKNTTQMLFAVLINWYFCLCEDQV